jgi:hypothetical protein
MRTWLFPDPPRRIPADRWIGVALRTAHLLAVGTLLGGHVFDVDKPRLVPFLLAAVATGVAMMVLEIAATAEWLCMVKGALAVLKVTLLAAVPVFWEQRVALLIAVTVLAGVSSHMPARYRHYSLVARRTTRWSDVSS